MQSPSNCCKRPPCAKDRTLDLLKEGESAFVLRLAQQGAQIRDRLLSMGLCPGAKVRVVSHAEQESLVLSVCGSRLVLGPALAEQIYVR